jgi:mannosyltransferase
MTQTAQQDLEIGEVVLGNSNARFSGVTSTMLQVLQHQKALISTSVLGKHNLPSGTRITSFWHCAKYLKRPLPRGAYRIFHARRNNEMLQALLLKYCFRAKIKIIFTATAQRFPTWITRWLIAQTDGLITTSNAAAAYLPQKQDVIIPHGIDSNRYSPPLKSKRDAWNELGLPGEYGIGIFGRVRPQKGVDLLIDAMIPILKRESENKATIVIVGETTPKYEPYLQSLKERIKAAGLEGRFQFLGKQPFERIRVLFQGMSLVAALSRNEGYGLTVLEAMASGSAVIASEAGAWADMIQDNSFGRLVPIDDLQATESALDALVSLSTEELESMGAIARKQIVEHYGIEKEAERLIQFYRNVQNATT